MERAWDPKPVRDTHNQHFTELHAFGVVESLPNPFWCNTLGDAFALSVPVGPSYAHARAWSDSVV